MHLAASRRGGNLKVSCLYHLVYLTIVRDKYVLVKMTLQNVINFVEIFILNCLARKICRNERRYLIVIYREFLRRTDLMLPDHIASCYGVIRWIL
jgi:hypothetical protein